MLQESASHSGSGKRLVYGVSAHCPDGDLGADDWQSPPGCHWPAGQCVGHLPADTVAGRS